MLEKFLIENKLTDTKDLRVAYKDYKDIIATQAKDARNKDPNWQYTQERIQKIKENEYRLPKVYMPLVSPGIGYITGGYSKPGDVKTFLVEWVHHDDLFDEEYLVSTVIDEHFNFDQPWKVFEVPSESTVSVEDLSSVLIELVSIFNQNKEKPFYEKPTNFAKGVLHHGIPV